MFEGIKCPQRFFWGVKRDRFLDVVDSYKKCRTLNTSPEELNGKRIANFVFH